jgi:hypothetical protein
MLLNKLIVRIRRVLGALLQVPAKLFKLTVDTDHIKINQGLILARLNETLESTELQSYEFSVFSQWGEDGIIQHLTRTIEIKNRTFIEFGVETFTESNCRFLLVKDNWQGFVIDGSAANMATLRASYYFWKYPLECLAAFVTRENVNSLLQQSKFDEDLGILSVDIDGNDFHVLEAITSFRPRILICEYNALFGPSRCITVPYVSDFQRSKAHHSSLYFGASLGALTHLAEKKGYSLVGVTRSGVNAFFVRNDLMNRDLVALTVDQAFEESRFRESRDTLGRHTYLSGDQRLAQIKGLPVFNVLDQEIEAL